MCYSRFFFNLWKKFNQTVERDFSVAVNNLKFPVSRATCGLLVTYQVFESAFIDFLLPAVNKHDLFLFTYERGIKWLFLLQAIAALFL